MPFDPTPLAEAPVTPDLSKLNSRTAAYIARHPETWPIGWQWDYNQYSKNNCGCLVGILYARFGALPVNTWANADSRKVQALVNAHMSYADLANRAAVTPEHVANLFDKIND